MHDIVLEEYENHVNGDASVAFYEHLDACSACREQVAAMSEVSFFVQELRPSHSESASETSPLGFYNRVASRIVEKQRTEVWGLFSPGAAFFRRVAFASLLLLAGMGGFLVTRESSVSGASIGGADAAAIMAQHDALESHAESADRDRLLVTLANYRQ